MNEKSDIDKLIAQCKDWYNNANTLEMREFVDQIITKLFLLKRVAESHLWQEAEEYDFDETNFLEAYENLVLVARGER